eukprot:TRINITY_DN67768_c4_g2_i1.p1 TRINITY_DN67768_c4_g2~~TRINITY_DN67768_c4_g2_i1.p1  ORF type:complete len:552 (+),score=75.68 TRINITY_DN67768_c4_g2_i1:58-1713(+)
MSLSLLNPGSASVKNETALTINVNAARGLLDIMKSNLGPRGTVKMLVSGAGDIKITKDGNVLLGEMQIQHPTSQLIARTATAQDDITGDGTTSMILLVGELLKQAERYTSDKVHPRIITEGFELAKEEALKFLDTAPKMKIPVPASVKDGREIFVHVARCSVATKLQPEIANPLADILVDAVSCIHVPGKKIDLHMVELMHMQHKLGADTQFIEGLVLDHGSRHPSMPKRLENCYILTCNVGLEYEKSEDTSTYMYSDAQMRAKMAAAERKVVENKTQKIIDLKRQVCTEENGKTFVVINQKGIEPIALDMLSREGIIALRRAKRRNMERLTLACGGRAVNTVDDLSPEDLGQAGLVYEHVLGDEKYTFVEKVVNPTSCTILIKGPNKHTITQIKDAVRDGLRAVKNTIEDGCVVPGGGAFEIALAHHLETKFANTVQGRPKLGVKAFAEALLVIPKTLAENSGLDVTYTVIDLQEAYSKGDMVVGVDLNSGEAMDPTVAGVYDGYTVVRHMLNAAALVAMQLLLVDEIMKAGTGKRGGRGGKTAEDDPIE